MKNCNCGQIILTVLSISCLSVCLNVRANMSDDFIILEHDSTSETTKDMDATSQAENFDYEKYNYINGYQPAQNIGTQELALNNKFASNEDLSDLKELLREQNELLRENKSRSYNDTYRDRSAYSDREVNTYSGRPNNQPSYNNYDERLAQNQPQMSPYIDSDSRKQEPLYLAYNSPSQDSSSQNNVEEHMHTKEDQSFSNSKRESYAKNNARHDETGYHQQAQSNNQYHDHNEPVLLAHNTTDFRLDSNYDRNQYNITSNFIDEGSIDNSFSGLYDDQYVFNGSTRDTRGSSSAKYNDEIYQDDLASNSSHSYDDSQYSKGITHREYVPENMDRNVESLEIAGKEISSALNNLERLERYKKPRIIKVKDENMRKYGLGARVGIDWTGPIEPLMREIAGYSNYTLTVLGHSPAIPVLVSSSHSDIELGDVIREAHLQAKERADIAVYPKSKIIEIRYFELG